jgi:NitT/TauT family transport system substrate-binding protein
MEQDMDSDSACKPSRRAFLHYSLLGLLAGPYLSLTGCSKTEPLLRIASNVWPGYELLYLARHLGYFNDQEIRLTEVPSATVCIQLLAAGSVEGAMLTLDEVLTARADGLDLRVIAVLDVSLGADVLLARPGIESLQDLKGKRIGVEQSAVGAVMLDAVLQKAELGPADIDAVYMKVNNHRDAYNRGEVDALISFEPVKTQLLQQGAKLLFSSAETPGRIIDVLAVLPSAIDKNRLSLSKLVAAHFQARQYFLEHPQQASTVVAERLQLAPADVPASYRGLELPDLQQNRAYLQGDAPLLDKSARELVRIMEAAQLVPGRVSASNLLDGSFLKQPS